MKKIIEKHKLLWKEKSFYISILWGLLFSVASVFFNHFAESYTNRVSGQFVNDIILDNIRAYDVDGLLNYGVLIFVLFLIVVIIYKPERIPFFTKGLALFYSIRSFFIILTHLGSDPTRTPIDQTALMARFITGNDFFFSAHTGMPFLMALIFWDVKAIRYICIATSVFFGAMVLLGHLHYSIDVFSAFFITYGIYHISRTFFKKDMKLFEKA